jgi:hypothetical protein
MDLQQAAVAAALQWQPCRPLPLSLLPDRGHLRLSQPTLMESSPLKQQHGAPVCNSHPVLLCPLLSCPMVKPKEVVRRRTLFRCRLLRPIRTDSAHAQQHCWIEVTCYRRGLQSGKRVLITHLTQRWLAIKLRNSVRYLLELRLAVQSSRDESSPLQLLRCHSTQLRVPRCALTCTIAPPLRRKRLICTLLSHSSDQCTCIRAAARLLCSHQITSDVLLLRRSLVVRAQSDRQKVLYSLYLFPDRCESIRAIQQTINRSLVRRLVGVA